MFGRERVEYKTLAEIAKMRRAGLVVARALQAMRDSAADGVTTADLDAVARKVLEEAGAQSSFLGYHGFPATACISVNEEIVHGIPRAKTVRAGDVLSIDFGAIVDGWHGDAAFSMIVPETAGGAVPAHADPGDVALVADTESAMWAGIAAIGHGERVGDIGVAVESEVAGRYGIVREYVGHGIGSAMHQPPDVPNYNTRERGIKFRSGLCLAVEPMLTRGREETEILDDDWTVVSADASRAAHWEHTVAYTDHGIFVLTAEDGGGAELAARGVQIADPDFLFLAK